MTTVGEYLENMRGVLSDPAELGINPMWLDQERPTREAILTLRMDEGRDLFTDPSWVAGMLGGMYVGMALLLDPTKVEAMVDRGCPCGTPHVLVDRTTVVADLLVTAQALLAQHDFLMGIDQLGEVPDGEG